MLLYFIIVFAITLKDLSKIDDHIKSNNLNEISICNCLVRMNGSDPGQAPLQVGEHVATGLGPGVFRVELQLDGVEHAGVVVLDFALVHLVRK